MSSLMAITNLPPDLSSEEAPYRALQTSVAGVFLSTTTAMTFLRLVRGSCMDTRITPLMPRLRFKWLVNTGSRATRLISEDSEGVT